MASEFHVIITITYIVSMVSFSIFMVSFLMFKSLIHWTFFLE